MPQECKPRPVLASQTRDDKTPLRDRCLICQLCFQKHLQVKKQLFPFDRRSESLHCSYLVHQDFTLPTKNDVKTHSSYWKGTAVFVTQPNKLDKTLCCYTMEEIPE